MGGGGGGGGAGLGMEWGVQSPSPSQYLSLCMQYMALLSASRPSRYIHARILSTTNKLCPYRFI